jgi:hypothetical protein
MHATVLRCRVEAPGVNAFERRTLRADSQLARSPSARQFEYVRDKLRITTPAILRLG